MADLVLTTFDWVPETPQGYVRDLRVRWALEEAALPYRVESAPFGDRTPAHVAHQPFGQMPRLTDGNISIFESGAILFHLGERSAALMSGANLRLTGDEAAHASCLGSSEKFAKGPRQILILPGFIEQR
jgi:hypothetical protein